MYSSDDKGAKKVFSGFVWASGFDLGIETEKRLMDHEQKKERYLDFKRELDGLRPRIQQLRNPPLVRTLPLEQETLCHKRCKRERFN
eukprot:3720659-Amphidinium_carterae.1